MKEKLHSHDLLMVSGDLQAINDNPTYLLCKKKKVYCNKSIPTKDETHTATQRFAETISGWAFINFLLSNSLDISGTAMFLLYTYYDMLQDCTRNHCRVVLKSVEGLFFEMLYSCIS